MKGKDNNLPILIRRETPQDFNAVYQVVKEAFASAEHSDGDEQDLVCRLRKSAAFIPELSLVAETDGNIIGFIMFTKLKVGNTVQLALAPLAVLPSFQGNGVGGMLIQKGHQIAQRLSYELSILIGYPDYYARFGYEKATRFGLKSPFDLPEEVFMVRNLTDKPVQINGTVEYPKEFFNKNSI